MLHKRVSIPTMNLCMYIQWNPSIMDTIGNQNFVRYREVSPVQGFPVYISSRLGMRNRAFEHNVAAFSELFFAVHWQGRLVIQITALI